MSTNKVNVVLGSQWGDEGKGKLVDILASDADVVARCAVSCHESLNTNLYIKKYKKKKIYLCVLKKLIKKKKYNRVNKIIVK